MLRTALLILSGSAASSLLLLARNLIIARLITLEDYGIAATFALVMAMVEMMSTLGLQQQIVQSKRGDEPYYQAALQGFQVLRGVVTGVVMFLIAAPLASFLHVPHIAWAYQLMALVPVLTALVHFDIYRLNRQMIYTPGILAVVVPALISLLLVWPLFALFGDWKVMLYAIIAQAGLMALVSHLVSPSRYRLLLDRAIMRDNLKFGWPLLVNGGLLFLVFNGEKLVVGRELGMAPLAIFAMGMTLTLTPTLIAAASVQRFFLPQLSAARAEPGRFTHLAMAAAQASLLIGPLLVIGVLLFATPLIGLILGERYLPLVPLMTWLAILQAVRAFKTGSGVIALAVGQTANALVSNIFRVLSLFVSWAVLIQGGDMLDVIWIATGAELLGFVAALLLVRYRLALSLRPLIVPMALSTLLLILAVPGVMARLVGRDSLADWIIAIPLAGVCLALVATSSDLRRYWTTRQLKGFDTPS